MDIEFIVSIWEDSTTFVAFCDICEQPVILTGEFVIKIKTDDGRKFLLAKVINCRSCCGPILIPKTFDSSSETFESVLDTYNLLINQDDFSAVTKIPLIEPSDLQEIFN
jgi:hypothetical protein